MKNRIAFLISIMAISNHVFSQISVPKCDVSIVKSDSLVWIEKYDALVICRSTGERESVLVGQPKSSYNLDTLKFKIIESKDLLLGDVSRVYLSSKHLSFVEISSLNSSFRIFKKRRKSLFSKKYWEEITPPLILPPVQSLLFGPYSSPNLDIINQIVFTDVFSIKVYYTNGKSNSFTFNLKTNTFTTAYIQKTQ
jgi:hypothetical protein